MSNLAELRVDSEVEGEILHVEYEVLPAVDILDPQKLAILHGLSSVEERLAITQVEIDKLDTEIDKLTNHADGIDYALAVASGILCGLLDAFWVGEFSLDKANEIGGEKVNKFVVKVAKSQGFKGSDEDVEGAIRYLAEQKKHAGGGKSGFHLASDSNTSDFGGGRQHHLRDFAHHPNLIGLCFSMLTQFTEKAYGTDKSGNFMVVEVKDKAFIGKDLPHKVLFGFVFWVFHMVSDMAGSGAGPGTGLPGPLVSFLKELSALPFFKKNINGDKEFSVWVSRLFNGTLLAKRDENGKIIEAVKFDLRTEIGIAHELGKQAIPVLINECIVRGFYFLRRFVIEIRENEVQTFADFKKINWEKTIPANNRTIARMLTISTSTFTTVDLADAAIHAAAKSKGVDPATYAVSFAKNTLLRVNFVGIGRCIVAIGTDIGMGVKKGNFEQKRMVIMGEQLALLNAKVYYKNAAAQIAIGEVFREQVCMWQAAESTVASLQEAFGNAEINMKMTLENLAATYEALEQNIDVDDIRKHNPGLPEEIRKRLRF